MNQKVEIPVGSEKEYLTGLYDEPKANTILERTRTLAIMLHDIPGDHKDSHDNLYTELQFLLSDLGFQTLRFDFRGCGQSEGNTEDLSLKSTDEDMQSVLDWASKQGFKKFIFVASGLSTATAFKNAPKNTDAFILFWPITKTKEHASMHYHSDSEDLDYDAPGYTIVDGQKISLQLIKNMMETDLTKDIQRAKAPILLQYGLDDPYDAELHNDFLVKAAKGNALRVDITSYEGGNRGLTNAKHRKMIFYHISQFIEKYT